MIVRKIECLWVKVIGKTKTVGKWNTFVFVESNNSGGSEVF